jgi:hypothetical protein
MVAMSIVVGIERALRSRERSRAHELDADQASRATTNPRLTLDAVVECSTHEMMIS